jgi:hypothetical protein
LTTLTSMLTAFGVRLAMHPELIFGPSLPDDDSILVAPLTDHHRKAA